MVSRSENNHAYFKKNLEGRGKKNVRVTSVDRDGLSFLIDEMKPDLMIMGARFNQCSTPYMMGLIKQDFPWLNMAAVCFGEYPADLGMYFILNGVKSYFNMFEGIEQFHLGIEKILEGGKFVSEAAIERMAMRKDLPPPAGRLPQKHIEVIRCICNGFQKNEIADNLYLSERTVANYREQIYMRLNVRNGEELFTAALELHFVTEEELIFRPRRLTLKPLPDKRKVRKEQITGNR